ncbi:unnamed protein product [Closterium sp. NIES-64]|nr:unnamed protein product [Closterium sp. NIES-64]
MLRFIDINSDFSKFELSLVLVSGYLSYSVAEMLSLSGIMALFFCGICNAHYGAEAIKFELSLMLVSAYLSSSVAEMLSLSCIMALFFCGICNAHCGYYNISHASKISSKYAFEALSFMAEMFVFAYLGMQVVVMQHVIDWGLLLSAIPLCLISRAFNVFPLSFLSNCTQANKIPANMILMMANKIPTNMILMMANKIPTNMILMMANKIPTNMILMMWLSGLRGAIAFALALNMPQRNPAIISTTLFVVVLTTVVMGGSTCPLLRALGLSAAHPHTPKHARASLAAEAAEAEEQLEHHHSIRTVPSLDVPLIGGRSLNDLLYMQRSHSLSFAPPSGLHKWFKWLDTHYLKPLFGGRAFRDQHLSEQLSVDEEEAMEGIPCFSYRGIGFSLSVPRNWVEQLPSAFEDHVLVKFSDPDVTIDGDPVAELDVICFSVRPSGISSLTEFGDPMNFLLTEWDDICPELAAGVSASSKVGSSGGDTSKAGGAGTSKPLRGEPSGTSGREQTSQAALPSMPSLARARSQTSHAARAAPAFVIWAEELISAGGKFFRYELVVHPEDLGDHKADIQHLLLCAGVSNGAVHVCRVRGTEAFFFDGRPLLKHILDSFALS